MHAQTFPEDPKNAAVPLDSNGRCTNIDSTTTEVDRRRARPVMAVRAMLLAMVLSMSLGVRDCGALSATQLAYVKSARMASMGIRNVILPWKSPYSTAPYAMRHIAPFQRPAGIRAEGVGYSPYSPAQALRNSCHYGTRRIVAHSVVRGVDGYYATVYYR